jgi:glyoxylase-like metal-dependent hydrolase (beta-lactamase superfamily II)
VAAIVPGEVVRLSPLVARLTAPNPGVMTGPGTNTYLVGAEALAVIDPGPDIASHVAAILAAGAGRIRWILCTHTHLDHSPAARAVKAATGARVYGMSPPSGGRQDSEFAPDEVLRDGGIVDGVAFGLRAVHTPGHASNHLCYLLDKERALFTGDHVMQGSTVVINPPDGDMQAYLAALERLTTLDLARLYPGHGHPIDTPHEEARRLIAHRLKREAKVATALQASAGGDLDALVRLVYDDVPATLYPVARRSLEAHLIKLAREGRAAEAGGCWKPLPGTLGP